MGTGTRGPIGKRSEELMGHRSKEEKDAVTKAPGAAVVVMPEPDPLWHPIARRWYESLGESGQSRFYEPSDWAAAQYAAEAMTRNLNNDRFSAQLFTGIWSALNDLLTTEGDRRRVRMELQRPKTGDDPAGVTVLDDYRTALGG
jgi:hypothetical protein